MQNRFKHPDLNKCYNAWIGIAPIHVAAAHSPGSNREHAFKAGYLGYKVMYARNTPLYAIYIAGKEWAKVNKKLTKDPVLSEMNAHRERYKDRSADTDKQ